MGSPTLPDPMFDQASATTLTDFSRRKSGKKSIKAKTKTRPMTSMKPMSKRRPK